MRHGNKNPKGGKNAKQTAKGRRQVVQAAGQFLKGLPFEVVISSEMDRAVEAAELAYSASRGCGVHVAKHPDRRPDDFGFEGYPYHEFDYGSEKEGDKKEAGEIVTVADWNRWAPEGMALARSRVGEGLSKAAVELAKESNKYGLITGHTPLLESPVISPEQTEVMGEAGIIRYTIKVDRKNWTTEIVGSQVIFQGF